MPDSQPLKLFIIYAREDQPALLELKAHLRPLEKRGDLTVWYDGEILPGQDWDKIIKEQLATSDIVMLFISKHFFNSAYIEKEELKKALERHQKGEATVVPVIVKPCYWEAHDEIAALQVLPKDGKAVVSWGDADEAWVDVVRGVRLLSSKVYIPMPPKKEIISTQGKQADDPIDVVELVKMGKKYYNGVSSSQNFYLPGEVPQDYSEAKKWFLKAAEKGSAEGQEHLGFIYLNGYGVEINNPEALKWFRLAAEQGHSNSQNNLGEMYRLGYGVAQDYTEAAKWIRKSAEQGGDYAQYMLGVLYQNGQGVNQNDAEAVKWWRKAAEQGNARGQTNLGLMYYNGGLGVPRDDNEAVKWWRKAAEQGNVYGQYNLGIMYENGRGVTKDLATAVDWYRKAAAQGYETAKANLKRLGYPE